MASSSNVIVAVRVRPLNSRETKLSSPLVVSMADQKTELKAASKKGQSTQRREFVFDYSFWSAEPKDEHFANQEFVFERLGLGCLDNAFEGYNACIFAYGQTGSGKSYTMMGGAEEEKGIIPRLCEQVFQRIAELSSETVSYKVEVSYMEIYNEKVRDLLGDVRNQKKSLKVREHRIMGPYVEGLTKLAVQDFGTIKRLMDEGNQSRTVASTNMNSESSRSHAVFNIVMTQHRYDPVTQHIGEKVSKISLVDLAGSERAGKTGASGHHLREGSNINKSLTTLGLVISSLAELSKKGQKSSGNFVPYRDSQLTWLLKENLGGNSKTVMVATVSPAADNYEETLSTLRYADRAKQIVNHAVVNEDPNERIIRELREEVDKLKASLGVTTDVQSAADVQALRDQLSENEGLMAELNMTWEEKLEAANKLLEERERALSEMGIHVAGSAIAVDIKKSYLVNINADPAMNEILVYYLKDSVTRIGTNDAGMQQDIVLSGLGIAKEHAVINGEDGMLYVTPILPAQTFVNGVPCTEKTLLAHGFRLALGPNHLFRVCTTHKADGGEGGDPQMSWADAQKELALKMDADFEKEKTAALKEQAALFEAKIQALKEQGVLLDAEAKAQARREAEAEAARLERERERAREDVSKVSQLVREANALAEELEVPIRYTLKMRLSLHALCNPSTESAASRQIAITASDQTAGTSRVILLDPFMSQLNYFRDVYEAVREGSVDKAAMPTHFAPAGMELIGVAHVFLSSLRHGITLELNPTVINMDGVASGDLRVRFAIEPKLPVSVDSETDAPIEIGDVLRLRVSVIEARGIPYTLSTHVNARFTFFQHDEILVPEKVASPEQSTSDSLIEGARSGVTKEFDQSWDKLLETEVTEELLAYMQGGTMPVQLWGHNIDLTLDHATSRTNTLKKESFQRSSTSPALSRKAASMLGIEVTHQDERRATHRQFSERWRPHCRQLNMWIQILELNDEGQYTPVGVSMFKGVTAGPVSQIRQGYTKSLSIQISQPDPNRLLPIARVCAVRIGEIVLVDASEAQMDTSSFGEPHIGLIREKFTEMVNDRQTELEEAIRVNEKAEEDRGVMFKEWTSLVAERDALLSPEVDSGLPGADTTAEIPPGYEPAITTIYAGSMDGSSPVKKKATTSMLPLHIVKQTADEWPGEVTCLVSWDIAAHNSPHLNKVTDPRFLVYLQLQVDCQLSNSTSFTLNKYVVCQVHKRGHKFRDTGRRSFFFGNTPSIPRGTGVIYRVFTSVPRFDATDDTAAEVQTETASKHFSEIAASLKNLVEIDRLKQDMLMRTVKLTKPTVLANLTKARTAYLGRSRSMNELAPSTAIELELQSKLRMAKSLGDETEARRISTQLDQMKLLKRPDNDDDEWVVIESEMERDPSGRGANVTFRRPASSTPLPPADDDTDETESKSMMALFRQKITGASSSKELEKVGQFISLTKEQGALTPVDLEALRVVYQRQTDYVMRVETPPNHTSTPRGGSRVDFPPVPVDSTLRTSRQSEDSPAVRDLQTGSAGRPDSTDVIGSVWKNASSASAVDPWIQGSEVAQMQAEAKPTETAEAETERPKAEKADAALLKAEAEVVPATEAIRLQEKETEVVRSKAKANAAEAAVAEAATLKAEAAEASVAASEAAKPKAETEAAESARVKAEAEAAEAVAAEAARVKAEAEAAEAARVQAEAEAAEAVAAEAARVKAEAEAAEAARVQAEAEAAEAVAAEAARVKAEAEAAEAARVQAEAEAAEAAAAEAARERAETEAVEAAATEAARLKTEADAAEAAEAARLKEEEAEAARLKAESEATAAAEAAKLQAEKAEEARLKADAEATAAAKAARLLLEKAEIARVKAEEEAAAETARFEAEEKAVQLKAEAESAVDAGEEACTKTSKSGKGTQAKKKDPKKGAGESRRRSASTASASADTAEHRGRLSSRNSRNSSESLTVKTTRTRSKSPRPGSRPRSSSPALSLKGSGTAGSRSAKDKRRLPTPPTPADRATPSPLVVPKAKPKFAIPVGEYVVATTKSGAYPGYLRFYGTVEFDKGNWCGVELTAPKGAHNGTVQDVSYFSCADNHGIFVLPSRVSKLRKPKT